MINAVRKSLSFLSKKERRIYYSLVVMRAISGLLDVLGIALVGFLAGLAATNLDSSKPLKIMGIVLPVATESSLLLLVVLVLLVFVFKAIIAIALGRTISRFLAKIESEKAVEIAHYLFGTNLNKMLSLSKGEILWAVMGSSAFAFSGLLTSLTTFITEGILLCLIALTFLVIDPIATIFVFVYFGILIAIIQFVIGKSLKKAGIDSAEGNMFSTVSVSDLIEAYREITVTKSQHFFINRFNENRFRLASSQGTMSFLGGMPRYVVETALMLGVVVFVGWQFLTGQLAEGLVTVGVFLTGGVRIMASLLPLQNAVANVKNQVEQSEMAQSLLSEIQEHHFNVSSNGSIPQQPDHAGSQNSQIKIEDVSFSYPNTDIFVLDNVNLIIQPGTHVAIIGPSGSGKTTLVDLILGLLQPSSGRIQIGNMDPVALLHGTQDSGIAYVPQRPGIVSGSLAQNIALGKTDQEIDPELLDNAIDAASLRDFVNSLPDGILTTVGQQTDGLSGGQIQRIGLARALYEQPRIIVLDEATSALDASSEAFVSSSIQNLGEDVTVIVIAHRLSTVQHADNVVLLENGSITGQGTFQELRKTVPMVAEYVRLMSFDAE